jgi:hypothetical protein
MYTVCIPQGGVSIESVYPQVVRLRGRLDELAEGRAELARRGERASITQVDT